MREVVARNRFIEYCEKMINDKPNKEGIRLQKTSYVVNYKGEIMTVTIERGDKLNVEGYECFHLEAREIRDLRERTKNA